jgi:hypothetical protein
MLQPSATSLKGISQGLAGAIQEATQAREAMDKCATNLEKCLRDLSLAMNRHHSKLTALLTQASVRPESGAIAEILHVQAAFNGEYLRLHSQMQQENMRYTTVSNILKTKHDTVKNSINNVR